MIFEVSPSQIEGLSATDLVKLLGRLLYAEAGKAEINLRTVSVPLQIFVSDGGEDARINWSDGLNQTDYLPCRFCIFQSKASNLGPAGWKKEVWSKGSGKKGKKNASPPKLNDAIKQALANQGAYIGFTSTALGGTKLAERIQAIRNGISEAGEDPSQLAAIELYDANKIAQWCSHHAAVAVWLNELTTGLEYDGFRTIEGWGKQSENSSVPLVVDSAARYSLDGKTVAAGEGGTPADNTLNFQQAKDRIIDHLLESGRCVRLIGPSGVGKSRSAYEVFNDTSTLAKLVSATAVIYCNHKSMVHTQILNVARALAQEGNPAIMVVDECPRDALAVGLGDIANEEGSALRVVTIDTDDRPIQGSQWINISLARSDDALIDGIVRQRLPKADDLTIGHIKGLCGGFPRIAVLATQNYANKMPILRSIDDVVDRILDGCGIKSDDHLRAIECLALFDKLGADSEFSDQFDLVAETLANLSGDRMYEYIAKASNSHIVDRRGRYFAAQPEPISAFLGARRLELLRVSTLLKFIDAAPPELLTHFFKQWRYFDDTRTAPFVAERLLRPSGPYGTLDALNTESGSAILDALVHVAPGTACDTLVRVLGPLSLDELQSFGPGRRHVVWALEKLVFRRQTFASSARLILHLGAAENEQWANNASGLFKQLYQLYLSGTQAPPSDRFTILDEGLSSGDAAIVALCVEALANTLKEGHFSRSGGAEQLGSAIPLRDWSPDTWSQVHDFHRQGLTRLQRIRQQGGELAGRCEAIITSHLRGLLMLGPLLPDITNIVTSIAGEKGVWLEAIDSVGDWLYFDRNKGAPAEYVAAVRKLYDDLLPTDPVRQILLYTKFWPAEIRNPDSIYDANDRSTRDYEYSTRKARELAAEIAPNDELVRRVLIEMAPQDLHNAFPFAQELGSKVPDPVATFTAAVDAYSSGSAPKGMQLIRGLLNGIDGRDQQLGNQCLQLALASETLRPNALDLYTAITITPERLVEVAENLRQGVLQADFCASLSYGRGLDHLSATELQPLLDELGANHGAAGVWTALEIISMYQHGRPALDADLERITKQLLASPHLLESDRGNRDGYTLETLVDLISTKGSHDTPFAVSMGDLIVRLCQTRDYDLFSSLDSAASKIISILATSQPQAFFGVLGRFFEIATPFERHQLEELVGPSDRGETYATGGLLYGLPEYQLFTWADSDPENRAPFLCMFYPMLTGAATATPSWHEGMERLAARYGNVESFRTQLTTRLRPSSWWGSIVPFLEVLLAPLETWFDHPIPELAQWARTVHYRLERQIEHERRDDEENR